MEQLRRVEDAVGKTVMAASSSDGRLLMSFTDNSFFVADAEPLAELPEINVTRTIATDVDLYFMDLIDRKELDRREKVKKSQTRQSRIEKLRNELAELESEEE